MRAITMETVLYGTVINAESVGVSHDLCGTMDGNPDRDNFSIVVPDGQSWELFVEWFLMLDDCSIIRYGDTNSFAEIGASPWKIKDGEVIELRFSDYLNALIDWEVRCAKQEIHMSGLAALKRLDALASN